MVDLDYSEDSNADTDMNVVMVEDGGFIEIQGTAEQEPFGRKSLDAMLELAETSIKELFLKQKAVLNSSSNKVGV